MRRIAIGLIALLLGGCFATESNTAIESPAASPAIESPTASASSPTASATPATPAVQPSPTSTTATITVEGEPTEVEMSRYESPDFVTTVPREFTATPGASDEGRDVKFNFSPTGTVDEAAYVQISFLREAISAAALTTQIADEMESNSWEILDRTDSPQYSWAETAIDYQQSGEDMITGTILIGEHQGRAFIVSTHYPIEYAEGFAPRADLILQNLELR